VIMEPQCPINTYHLSTLVNRLSLTKLRTEEGGLIPSRTNTTKPARKTRVPVGESIASLDYIVGKPRIVRTDHEREQLPPPREREAHTMNFKLSISSVEKRQVLSTSLA
jgi:hypothetical protein